MFADDLIIRYSDQTPKKIQDYLENLSNKINKYCHTWHLKINVWKCETILFRPPVSKLSSKSQKEYKNFKIHISDVITNEKMLIPHKNIVKYLGVYLDALMRLAGHTNSQLDKARKAFYANRSLFYCEHLNAKAKIICYMLLISPIITYAAPIWFNFSASMAEKFRKFERSCIRVCLGKYKTPESDYKKYYSN